MLWLGKKRLVTDVSYGQTREYTIICLSLEGRTICHTHDTTELVKHWNGYQ